FPITTQGTTIVTWTFNDGNGNSTTANQNVIIDDVTDPTITCVGDQTINLPIGETTYTVSGTEFDPTSTNDNCGVASVENDYNSTSTLADEVLSAGTYTISWTVTDDAGNTNSCQTVLTINETIIPENALNFDGVDDYVNIGNQTELQFGSGSFTIESWINTTSANSYLPIIAKSGVSEDISLCLVDGYASLKSFYTTVSGVTFINDGNWHHIAVTKDGMNVSIYVDGMLETFVDNFAENVPDDGNVVIGTWSAIDFLTGNIDEVRIWNTVKTECDIYSYMNSELVGDEEGLVACFDFNNGIAEGENSAYTTLEDKTVNGFDGTLINFALTGSTSNWIESTVDLSGVNDDITDPTITCVENQTINLNEGETFYTVQGTEFDPTSFYDNCGVMLVVNDYNSTETLANEEFTAGTYTITWVVSDNAGNLAECSFDLTVNDYIFVSELAELGISIYPNPTEGLFTISSEQKTINNIEITDVTGKLIYKSEINNVKASIDITEHANGMYFIRLSGEGFSATTKIIKM
ncbi:MAG: HYR domain-containing protein, partial [Bacteroidales bacterium]|nr:HYR domain-containing protein [Bacteroidales bacterium]